MVKGIAGCEIRVGCQRYCIVRTSGKATFRIVNMEGQIVAQVYILCSLFLLVSFLSQYIVLALV